MELGPESVDWQSGMNAKESEGMEDAVRLWSGRVERPRKDAGRAPEFMGSSHQFRRMVPYSRSLCRAAVKVCLLVGCLTSQQQASVSQGRICSDNFTCCHTQIDVADPTFYLTQSQYTYTGPTSPSADPVTPGAWQGSHWSANFEVTGMTRPRKNPGASGIRTRDLPLSWQTPYH